MRRKLVTVMDKIPPVASVSAVTDAAFRHDTGKGFIGGSLFWQDGDAIREMSIVGETGDFIDSTDAELKAISGTVTRLPLQLKAVWLFSDNRSAVTWLKTQKQPPQKYRAIVQAIKDGLRSLSTNGTAVEVAWKERSNKKIQSLHRRVHQK